MHTAFGEHSFILRWLYTASAIHKLSKPTQVDVEYGDVPIADSLRALETAISQAENESVNVPL